MDQAQPLGFGNYFTPHLVAAQWADGYGWSAAEVTTHEALTLAPSAMVLHYGQAVIEGLKAYPGPDESLNLFRPRRSAERFNRSAARLAMPPLPADVFIAACEKLVRADHAHAPRHSGASLYLRPFMIATEASISVRSSSSYLFVVIASPVGSFFAEGVTSITAWCQGEYARATLGGTGAAKCAGNYAASLVAKAEAQRRGCEDVLWLDAAERRWVEEFSAMNFFCAFRSARESPELATPPLSGTILDGNTRDSVLRLAARRGVRTVERPIDIAEIIGPDSTATEAFACGTAAGVAPVSHITAHSGRHQIGNGRPGALTMQLRNDLIAIQEGQAPDEHGWMHGVRLTAARLDPVGAAASRSADSASGAARDNGRPDRDDA